ncbi:MAG: hypothetical protein HWD86_07805 [Kangiellaceae bacterium]|nr:hypothetical protein [Kangiellaceae bacterium]
MSKITILAGDFPTGTGHFTFRNFTLPGDDNHYLCETVCASQLEFLNSATKEMVLLLEADKDLEDKIMQPQPGQVMFMARFKDKRRFIGSTDERTYAKIVKSSHKEAGLAIQAQPSAA